MLFFKRHWAVSLSLQLPAAAQPRRVASRAGRAWPGSRGCQVPVFLILCHANFGHRGSKPGCWESCLPAQPPARLLISGMSCVTDLPCWILLPVPEGGSRPGPSTHSTNAAPHQCNSCTEASLLQLDRRHGEVSASARRCPRPRSSRSDVLKAKGALGLKSAR